MDDRGRIYADDATCVDLEKEFNRKVAKSIDQAPKDSSLQQIETRKLLSLIAGMSRKTRKRYYVLRKLGNTPDVCLAFLGRV